MKRKDYQTPAMEVLKFQHQSLIMAGSPYETSGQGNTSIEDMEDVEDL